LFIGTSDSKNICFEVTTCLDKKFELMLTRRAKAYSSSSSVV